MERHSKSYIQRWRERQDDENDNEQLARLELELGRFAQGAALACGFIFVFTAYIASLLGTSQNLPFVSGFRRPEMVLWFPLLAVSFVVAGFTVAKKIGPYRRGIVSGHFLSSLIAFAVATILLALALSDHFGLFFIGPLAALMYPGSALGMSLALVSLALTWEGIGFRRVASMASSLAIPISLSLIPLLGMDYRDTRLILVYALDVMFIAFSGSLLLLVASAGDATQREILKASDSKLAALKHEMSNKLSALAYKEKAYVERESHLDAKERSLLEIETELNARARELNAAQTKIEGQSRSLEDFEGRLAKTRAEIEAKMEELSLQEKDLKSLREQVEAERVSLAHGEEEVTKREQEVKRNQIEVTSRERTVEGKSKELEGMEKRLRADEKALEVRRDEVIRKQKQLELKESEVKLKLEQLEAQETGDTREKIRQLKDWETKVLAKEEEVAQLEVKLRSTQEELKQRASESDAYAAALAQERLDLEGREKELVAREKHASDLESGIGERNAEFERRMKEIAEVQERLGAREQEYNSMFKNAKLREADFSATKEEVSRRTAAMDAREAQIAKWKANLESDTKKLQNKAHQMISKEKELEAREAELSIKELEVTAKSRESVRAPPPAGSKDVDRDKYLEIADKRLKDREDEFKRRTYQREKELEAREMALKEQLKAAAPPAESGAGAVEITIDRKGRLRTGTPRLDDLLYGGLPMNANVLFVGPAFVGKEVGILNFVAEGLRANVPAVIVTTSKPSVEIAKDMAPVLPTFLEYEQLGLVRWIDASGTTPTKKLTREGRTYRVPNAADFDGILAAVNEADEEFRERGAPYFRLAFLTLSSSLTQADDKTALGFVQHFVNRLRQSKCVAAFALERGMHTDQQVESLQQLMDGALHFKADKAKTLMSVVGIGEVQSRDWIPYKFTNKALMIGSFQLERIR